MTIALRCVLFSIAALAIGAGPSATAGGKQKTAIKMTITMESACSNWFELGLWGCSEWNGKFRVSGAVSDRGPASAPEYGTEFTIGLDGKKGSITVLVSSDDWTVFAITGGTGAYAGITGGGSAEVDFTLLGDALDPDRVRAEFRLNGTVGYE